MISRALKLCALAAGSGVAVYIGCHALVVHAAVVTNTVPGAEAAPAAGWSLAEVMALLALILAGIGTVIDAARAFLHFLAPRTASPVDDRWAAKLDALHDRLAAIEGKLPAPAPAPKPPLATMAVLALIVLGLGAGAALPACGGSQSSRAQTVASLYTGLNAASAALRTYESDHAEAIIGAVRAHTMTPDAAAAALTELRARVHPAEVARDAAYAAVDLANTVNDDPSLAGARTAITNALGAITQITGSK